MSICMPLGDKHPRPDLRLITRLRSGAARPAEGANTPDQRIGDLEARMKRLETGQLTALNLVRQAMAALKEGQSEQHRIQTREMSRLAAQLTECEAALATLDAARKRDDETMRERFFDMGEALEGVRAMAAAAVRPGALRKLELAMRRETEAGDDKLRNDLAERIIEAVEAAEDRGAEALEALEDGVRDEMGELGNRVDILADTLAASRSQAEGDHEEGPSPAEHEMLASETEAQMQLSDWHTEEETPGSTVTEAPALPPSDVIPFPARPSATRERDCHDVSPATDVGAVLSAAARRVNEEPGEATTPETREPERASGPFGRLMTSAGSAVMAVCIMTGLSLLAGPVLGPNLQGAPPAFAHDNRGWTPVTVSPQPVVIAPRLVPVRGQSDEPHPVRKRQTPNSDR